MKKVELTKETEHLFYLKLFKLYSTANGKVNRE